MSNPLAHNAASSTDPTKRLQSLLSRRASVTGEVAGLQATRARLQALNHVEGSLIQQIEEIGRTEMAVMTEWARAGGEGDPPVPDQSKRCALAEQLAGAQAATAAAVGTIHDLDHQMRELNAQLASIDQQIEAASLDILQHDFTDFRERYSALMREGGVLAAKLHGFRSYLSGTGRTLIERGDAEAGKRYLARAEQMSTIKLPMPDVSQGEIFAAAENWGRRAAALRKGPVS